MTDTPPVEPSPENLPDDIEHPVTRMIPEESLEGYKAEPIDAETPVSEDKPHMEMTDTPLEQSEPEIPPIVKTTPPSQPTVSGVGATPPPPPLVEMLPSSDERTWATLAHLSIFANLITGFLGLFIALIIYLVYKDRSRYVAYHAMQSFVFQLIWWVGAGVVATALWVISFIFVVILVGCLCMPIALLVSLMPLAALVYSVVGAIQTSQGRDFKYWLIGDWLRNILEGN